MSNRLKKEEGKRTGGSAASLGFMITMFALLLIATISFMYGIGPGHEVLTYDETDSLKEAIGPCTDDDYKLEQVVVLSRHNIRSPLSGVGSALDTITPHKWHEWSSDASELSVRGGVLETEMGEYFRKYLEDEGLFEKNYMPDDKAVRIYSNSKQRTIATARYFSAGLLPACNFEVENHAEFDTMDPVFNPQLTFVSEEYDKAVKDEIHEMFDEKINGLEDNYKLLSTVIDVTDSEDYKNGKFTGFDTKDSEFTLEEGKEPSVSGSLKTACSVSDALVLQYYEESDKKKAAFGHNISDKDWEDISEIKDVYGDVLFTTKLVSVNVAHPLLVEIDKELNEGGRKFTYLVGHDSNLGSVLAALDTADYSLPEAIEKKTPIGSKLVISKWKNSLGNEVISLDLVYQKTDQLRGLTLLDKNNPPAIYNLKIKGIAADENGCYRLEDFMKRLNDAIDRYDVIVDEYGLDAAA